MRTKWKEIKINLFHSKYLSFIFVLHLSVILTLIGFLGINVMMQGNAYNDFYSIFNDQNVYNVMDIGGTETYSKVMNVENLEQIEELYHTLNQKYTYIHQIESSFPATYDDSKKQFMIGGKDSVDSYATSGIASYYSLRVNPNFFKIYSIHMAEGSFFDDNYMYKIGDTVPVILGNDYEQYYEVGDTFKGDYFLFPEETEYQVVGILEKESSYFGLSIGSYLSLDHYILVPDVNLTKENSYRPEVILANLSQKIPSMILSQEDSLKDLRSTIASYGMSEMYRIDDQREVINGIYHDAMNQFKTVLIAFVVLSLFSILIITMNCFRRISMNFERYAIHMANGASLKDITEYIMSDLAIQLGLSDFVAIVLNIIVSWRVVVNFRVNISFIPFVVLFIILFSLLIYFVIYIIVRLRLIKFKISDFIRGLEP